MAGEDTQDPQGGDGQDLQAQIAAAVEKELAGLKRNRDELLKEVKGYQAKLRSYEGVDPEEARTLKQQREQAEREAAEKAGNFAALEKQLLARSETEIAKREAQAEKYRKALERELVDARLTKAIAEKDGYVELLLPQLTRHVRVKETDEGFVAFVADEQGNQRIGDTKGNPMDFGMLVDEYRQHPVFSHAFKGAGGSGSGAPADGSGRATVPGTIRSDDDRGFAANLEAIASGKVKVV